jgi:hypothetical protein
MAWHGIVDAAGTKKASLQKEDYYDWHLFYVYQHKDHCYIANKIMVS